MTDLDQTVVLPVQRPASDDEVTPRPDAWVETPARGVAPVGGFGRTEKALVRLAWLLTTVTMAAVGLVRTGWSGLSPEELTTWALAETSWTQFWELRYEIDALTLPYHALIRAWADLAGTSEFSLRLPSVLAMVVAAGATAALLGRLVSARAGMLAGLLFAAVPATSRYAHEAGPEALAVAAGVLATVALVWLFERPSLWRWAGYTGAVLLLGLSHGAALLLLVGHGVAVLALRRRVLPAWLAAAVLGVGPVVAALFLARRPWDLPGWVDPVGMPSVTGAAGVLFGLAVLGGLVAGLGLIGLSMRKPAGVFTAVALAPLVGLYPATEFTTLRVPELLLFTLPGWLGLAALALERAPLVRGLLAVGVVALIGLPAQLDIRTDGGHGLASREVAAVLNAQVESGDAIIFGPDRTDERIGRDLVERYVPPPTRPADVLAATPPRTGGQLLATECADVDFCLADAPRVWLFRADESADPLAGLPAAKDGALRVRYEPVRTWRFTGAVLVLYTHAPADLDRPAPR